MTTNNVTTHDNNNLKLLYELAGSLPYNPATYTCIKEFKNNFPVKEKSAFVALPPATKSAWHTEAPYPRIYNKNYKTTIVAAVFVDGVRTNTI